MIDSLIEKIQEKKQGRIQAFYERKMRTSGFDGAYKTASGYRMKTGDNSRILEILAATVPVLALLLD